MSRPSASGSPYRLDELGWLQFDRLCGLVLDAEAGVGNLGWRGRSETLRVATVETPVALPGLKVAFTGPLTVAVLWVRDDGTAGFRLAALIARMEPLLGGPGGGESPWV